MEFRPMPKTPRLSREIVITEKIDGTNASVMIAPVPKPSEGDPDWPSPHQPERIAYWYGADASMWGIWAGSRTRWITPEDDNFGFARWVADHVDDLKLLGPGHHFGEWWGKGIQRGYGLDHRRFSLFNVGRWRDEHGATCSLICDVVPVLYRGPFAFDMVDLTLNQLGRLGSLAAPGFTDPEGVMVYHTASGQLFKKTLKGDEEGKHGEAHPKKERAPKPPKDPSKGGRRKEQLPFDGPDRRKK